LVYRILEKKDSIHNDLYYKNQKTLTYTIYYPQFASDKFKPFINKLNIYYKAEATLYQKYHVMKLYQMSVDDYEYASANNFPFNLYEILVEYQLTYNQNCMLSLYFDRYEFTGGAHGMTTRSGDTWNLQKGQRMTLSDFFSENKNYLSDIIEFINQQIELDIQKGNEYYFEDYAALVKENINERNFYLVPEGVVIFFQLYEIAPYVSGIRTFLIPFGEGAAAMPGCK
jgi:hypothetical protein